MLQRLGAIVVSCDVATSAFLKTCAQSSLSAKTIESAWEGNVNLSGLTPYPATSEISGWTNTPEGYPFKVFSHPDGALYIVTLLPQAEGTEIFIAYLSSGENAVALPSDSQLAKLVTQVARPTYTPPLIPDSVRTTQNDNLIGRVASVTTKTYNGKSNIPEGLQKTVITTYNEQGYQITWISTDSNGVLARKNVYEYENGRLKRVLDTRQTYTYITTFFYDVNGNWQKENNFNELGELLGIKTILPFPNGYESTVYKIDGKILSRQRVLLGKYGEELDSETDKGKSVVQKIYENSKLVKSVFRTPDFSYSIEFDSNTGDFIRAISKSKTLGEKYELYICRTRDQFGNCTFLIKYESDYGFSDANQVAEIEVREFTFYNGK